MITETNLLRAKVVEEINLLPEDKLQDIYQLIHYFRLGLQSSKKKKSTTKTQRNAKIDEILQFAGSWNDMSDLEFQVFLQDIENRRKTAFSGRLNRETSFD